MMKRFILLWLILPLQLPAETAVWRVGNGLSELYIGGTIHVLSKQDYPLPQEFYQAYQQADLLVLETDLAAMSQPEVQQRLLQMVVYTDGRSIQDDLMPATYRKLAEYVAATTLAMDRLKQFKLPMLVITLTMAELQRLGMGDIGVDNYFNDRARQDGKQLSGLETVEQQLKLISSMGKGQEDEMVLSTIEELKKLPLMMNHMKAAWRSGDMKQLEEIAIDPMRQEFPSLYQSLLVSRNDNWIPKIEALLTTPEKEFVLVGTLHLAAKEGVIQQLKERGYQVEKMQ